MNKLAIALCRVGGMTGAELSFQQVILDGSYIACERDVGDIDGDGHHDAVAGPQSLV